MADHEERPVNSSRWLQDRAAETNLLAADLTSPEARRDMTILAEIYRRWADRASKRSARRKTDSSY
jgi:hypothetical protein